ncbi:30S ribosomal protein S11 [Candidatus Falkowbacteria bacterium]|nr:MAG: 30S ribosomal protein S11 [Candidatus Falkowbacteria bacterium]
MTDKKDIKKIDKKIDKDKDKAAEKTVNTKDDKIKKEKSDQPEVKTIKKENEILSTGQGEKEKEDILEIKKDKLGLEELPEDIIKKLAKKKAEISKKTKAKKSKFVRKKKKEFRKVITGNAYIKSTYNNTIVTLTDLQGNVISWASAGIAGFKGPKKSTPYAAQIVTRIAVGKAREKFGLSEVSVFVRGVGTGRESAVRALNNNGLIVTSIKDVTPMPHNGCRNKRPRRV